MCEHKNVESYVENVESLIFGFAVRFIFPHKLIIHPVFPLFLFLRALGGGKFPTTERFAAPGCILRYRITFLLDICFYPDISEQ